ncbi:uncharacterized protein N7458_002466 [Penicillium daleae]|uniref:LysM domain-containing protein n=1 Tax=Penicillium daleae TaxID=63821 RepID=A0AAD6G5X1_9EURO|nr:uncharacterized protein N7458_002466 [Penicillium daleae]KAJ5460914.1 hypothetical protein N7458_002466 [Penicillium daleae]
MTTNTTTSTSTTGAPAPTKTGIVTNCQAWYVAQTNDTCAAIASANGITVSQFEAWNPAVGDTASTTTTTSTDSGTVTPPAPTQSGIVANCQEYYVVKADDTCATIASAYGITVS